MNRFSSGQTFFRVPLCARDGWRVVRGPSRDRCVRVSRTSSMLPKIGAGIALLIATLGAPSAHGQPGGGAPAPVFRPILDRLALAGLPVYLPTRVPRLGAQVHAIAFTGSTNNPSVPYGEAHYWEVGLAANLNRPCDACDLIDIIGSDASLPAASDSRPLRVYRSRYHLLRDTKGRLHMRWSVGTPRLHIDLMCQMVRRHTLHACDEALFIRIAGGFVRVS
jgi:hypothetical protein